MDGKLVLLVLQSDAALHVERLFEDHTTVILLSYLHLLIEEHESTEHRALLRVAVAKLQRTDDVETVLSTDEQLTLAGTEDGTLVERSRLQTIATVEVTDGKGPRAVLLFLWHDVRHTVIRRHPHRLPCILRH